ncbi:MAG: hypothetical protein KME21_29030 [Desmonostoc vinosum HA7617-LM4]|jgi:hypothetical protein|nr:hypothetical protein [Desmonostoc vinosum HA7617-LM4]
MHEIIASLEKLLNQDRFALELLVQLCQNPEQLIVDQSLRKQFGELGFIDSTGICDSVREVVLSLVKIEGIKITLDSSVVEQGNTA